VLVLGDNRFSTSIVRSVRQLRLELHQAIPLISTAEASQGVQLHKTSFFENSLRSIFSDTRPDILINTVSGGSFETQKLFIDQAILSGIPCFVPAEYGHDSLNTGIQERLPPYQQRAKTIQYLHEQAENGRISWVGVATGCLLDYGIHSGNLGFEIQWRSATLHGTGDERFAASSSARVGRVVGSIIEHWENVQNKYLYAAGTITTANEILQHLEAATGSKWDAGRYDVEDCVREAERRIALGFPDAGMFLIERSVLYDNSLNAVQPFIESDAKEQLGLVGEDLDDLVKEALHQHQHHGKGGCGCD
jgi:hypothetical protein